MSNRPNQEKAAKSSDSRIRAILAMNFFCIGSVGQSACFKIVSNGGVKLYDYQIFRNLAILILSSLWLWKVGINPVTAFPMNKKKTVCIRTAMGQLSFLVFNAALKMIPMTLHTILFQTNTFWISLLAFLVNSEPIIAVEIIGMVICFLAVAHITLNSAGDDADAVSVESYTHRHLGYALIMAGAWIFATINVLNRVLKELHHSLVMFYYSAFGFPLFVVIMLSQVWLKPEAEFLTFSYTSE